MTGKTKRGERLRSTERDVRSEAENREVRGKVKR